MIDYVIGITSDERVKIRKELTDVNGFLNVKDKQREIEARLGKIVSEDEHLKEIAIALNLLMHEKGFDKSE